MTGSTFGNIGATGLNFADMSYCDTAVALPQTGYAPLSSTPTGSLCQYANPGVNHGSATAFLATRSGFTVNENGRTINRVAVVIISHGETGYGAYQSSGTRLTLPNAGNVEEIAHTAANRNTGTYYVKIYAEDGKSDAIGSANVTVVAP